MTSLRRRYAKSAGWKRIAQGRFRYFPQTKPSSANEANE
jgi:hypothetical protein